MCFSATFTSKNRFKHQPVVVRIAFMGSNDFEGLTHAVRPHSVKVTP